MRELDPLPWCILDECFSEREMVGGVWMHAPMKDHVVIDIPHSHVGPWGGLKGGGLVD